MGDSNSVISLKNVSKSFGKQSVLENINLEIPQGQIFGIVGSSGSGKSTLLNIITGNLLPDSGDVLFEPKDLARYNLLEGQTHLQSTHKDYLALKRTVGYSTQDPSFYDMLTCSENLDFFGSLYKLPREVLRVNSKILLKLVGLEEWSHKLARDLSGGMQKRLDLACSLVHDPKILVLDEPTADLDFLLREQMWNLIQKIKQKGTTVIMSSHFIDEIESICDKIIILNHGQVEFIGSPRALKRRKGIALVIRIQTAERDYDLLREKLLASYGSKLETNFRESSGDFVIKIKSSKDYEKDFSKVLSIVKGLNQEVISVTYTKEGISEMFEQLHSVKKPEPEAKHGFFKWFKKSDDIKKSEVAVKETDKPKLGDEKAKGKKASTGKKPKKHKGGKK